MPPFDRPATSAGGAELAGRELYHAGVRAGGQSGPLQRRGTASVVSVLVVSVLYWGLHPRAAASAASQRETPQFSSGVQLVEVFATVSSAAGQPVTGLVASDFVVREDDVIQPVSVFVEAAFPLTVALGVDRSWSMAGEPLRQAKAASRAFLSALRPDDRAMVVSISAEPELVAPLSTNRSEQICAIAGLDPWSTTALRDALIGVLDQLEPEPGRLALVIFSDGVDRYSQSTSADVLARARRSRALVYPVHLGRGTRAGILDDVAALTGGRSFHSVAPAQLAATLRIVVNELRHQYLIGYVPARMPQSGAGEWRSIRVSMVGPRKGLHVRARAGYIVE